MFLRPPQPNAGDPSKPAPQQFELPQRSCRAKHAPQRLALATDRNSAGLLRFPVGNPATIRRTAAKLRLRRHARRHRRRPKGRRRAHLLPGDMAGMVLVRGDTSISSACTVTAVQGDRVFFCGHPFLSLGNVQFPWPAAKSSPRFPPTRLHQNCQRRRHHRHHHRRSSHRRHRQTRRASADDSARPYSLRQRFCEKKLHFEMVNHPKLTPLLVASPFSTASRKIPSTAKAPRCIFPAKSSVHGHAPVKSGKHLCAR